MEAWTYTHRYVLVELALPIPRQNIIIFNFWIVLFCIDVNSISFGLLFMALVYWIALSKLDKFSEANGLSNIFTTTLCASCQMV